MSAVRKELVNVSCRSQLNFLLEVETTAGLAGVRCVISTESVRRYRLDDASESGFASVIEPLRELTEYHESAAAHEMGHPL